MSITLPPLPYALDALEPYISRRTLAAHHGHHHAAYVAKTRALIQRTPLESASLEEVVLASAQQDKALFNVSAQAWNHEFYWRSVRPGGGGEASGAIAELIEESFGSHRTFSQQVVTVAGDQFGSGWAWLVLEAGRMRIIPTPNAQTPLTTKQVPLLTIDVWEHAYYLDYQHRRLDYIAAFLGHLIDWDFANQNLARQAALGVPDLVAG
ncbi:MAG: superoxide dismutase [Steroidobacteraceae bacterium]